MAADTVDQKSYVVSRWCRLSGNNQQHQGGTTRSAFQRASASTTAFLCRAYEWQEISAFVLAESVANTTAFVSPATF